MPGELGDTEVKSASICSGSLEFPFVDMFGFSRPFLRLGSGDDCLLMYYPKS